MKLKISQRYTNGVFNTDEVKLVSVVRESEVLLCIKEPGSNINSSFAKIVLGNYESEKMLAEEIVRRWNKAEANTATGSDAPQKRGHIPYSPF